MTPFITHLFSPNRGETYRPRAAPWVHGPQTLQPQRGESYQPKATPWVNGPHIVQP